MGHPSGTDQKPSGHLKESLGNYLETLGTSQGTSWELLRDLQGNLRNPLWIIKKPSGNLKGSLRTPLGTIKKPLGRHKDSLRKYHETFKKIQGPLRMFQETVRES